MSYLEELFNLRGKVALITGGTGFLGSKLAESFSRCGVKTAILDLDVSACERLSIGLSNKFTESLGLFCDITKIEEIKKCNDAILERFGKIDVLINCAAVSTTTPSTKINLEMIAAFENYQSDIINKVISVNLTGIILCCQVFGEQMKIQRNGSIINIGSIYGLVGPDHRIYPDFSKMNTPVAYSVSKGGILALTKYLATYWGTKNVRINCLTFGGVYNGQPKEFVENYSRNVPLGRMANIEEIVGVSLFLGSDASLYMTGENVIVDGGFTTW
jgi:NAD(P)-dependent dehydrogenase (short-subunit alcohol dehydrogenase family)